MSDNKIKVGLPPGLTDTRLGVQWAGRVRMSDSRSPEGAGFPRVVGGWDTPEAPVQRPATQGPRICHQVFTF